MISKLVLVSVAIALVAASDNCTEWPKSIAPLSECCATPYQLDWMAYYQCMSSCNMNTTEETCIFECYVNQTGIIDELGVFNKSAAAAVYKTNSYHRGWDRVIEAAVESCSNIFEESSNELEVDLIKFYLCVKNESQNDCMEFYMYDECYAAQDHFYECNKHKYNCLTWPEIFTNDTLMGCCKYPAIFTDEYYEYCSMRCTFAKDNYKCTQKCQYRDSGIFVDGIVNAAAIKHSMMSNHLAKPEWEPIIDEAVGACIPKLYEKMSAANSTAIENYFWDLEYCIELKMSANCIEFRTDQDCRPLEKYLADCPRAKPISEDKVDDNVIDVEEKNDLE